MGISLWQLLIILAIVLLLFGTKKLRSIGSDLGGAIKGFRENMSEEKTDTKSESSPEAMEDKAERVIEGEVNSKEEKKV